MSGIIMSMHLFEARHPHASDQTQLCLLCGYENGSVTMWGHTRQEELTSIEGRGWDMLWTAKLHVESGEHVTAKTAFCPRSIYLTSSNEVMALAVSKSHHVALTVSADHLIGRYDLVVR